MPCFHPLKAIKALPTDTRYLIGEKAVQAAERRRNAPTGDEKCDTLIEVPCGRCVGCRLSYSRVWADRCVAESLNYPQNKSWFVTLTYDDNYVPVGKKGLLTLVPQDVSAFMKRLRERWLRVHNEPEIRFFGAGEYGSTTYRPHYHLLLFGLEIYDLVYWSRGTDDNPLYTSNELEGVWQKGRVIVGEFSWSTAAYTARYCMKKLKGKESKGYERAGISPEFTRMSRRPGIGMNFYVQNYEQILQRDSYMLVNGRTASPPRLFLDKMAEAFPSRVEEIRRARQEYIRRMEAAERVMIGLSHDEVLVNKERVQLQKSNALIRK